MAHPTLAEEYGQSLLVKDAKERLIQNAHPVTLLLWPPNLFAFTSYVLHLSGAYQLVVSPPPGDQNLNHWPPTIELMGEIFHRLRRNAENECAERRETLMTLADACENQLRFADVRRRTFKTQDTYMPWTFLVRWAALDWRTMLDRQELDAYLGRLPVIADPEVVIPPGFESEVAAFPPLLRACWEVFRKLYPLAQTAANEPIIKTLLCNDPGQENVDAWHAATCLLTMHAIADDATVGWGILKGRAMPIDFPRLGDLEKLEEAHREGRWESAFDEYSKDVRFAELGDSPTQKKAAKLLDGERTMATIEVSRSRILPKRHNPDVGITLRSLSSNLAFHNSPIEVRWERDGDSDLARTLSQELAEHREPTFTILLLPLPMQVHTRDFKIVEGPEATEALDNRKGYGFFRYQPEGKREVLEEIKAIIDRAREEEPNVDVIVLPESALRSEECDDLARYLAQDREPGLNTRPVSAFIAGVTDSFSNGGRFKCNNMVRYGYREGTTEGNAFKTGDQYKHHRWQLAKSQVEQYGLSQVLDPETKWWEAINVQRRHVSFVNIGDAITVCPLICEDLARQDPIADLIRQVGPSLVVTILMDGPQHKDRWSSRYASILSEDPGSSVLALTSIGMVRRWNSPFGHLSRVVALWNDKQGLREIELEAGASGILLTLRVKPTPEVIADGRLEMCPTAKIFLTDVNQISIPPAPLKRRRNRKSAG